MNQACASFLIIALTQGIAWTETIASQDFNATNFPVTLILDNGNDEVTVDHIGSGASGTNLGFYANGIRSGSFTGITFFEVSSGFVTLSNFMEFAFGLDATTASNTAPNFPNFTLEGSAKKLKHRCRSNTTASFSYYLSEDLSSWSLLEEGVDYTLSVTPGAGIDEVEITLIGANAAKSRSFLRVMVEEE